AARRGECDLAGIHLLDPQTNTYNRPFLSDDLVLLPGYNRLQGIVYRRGGTRFLGATINEAAAEGTAGFHGLDGDPNPGGGTPGPLHPPDRQATTPRLRRTCPARLH